MASKKEFECVEKGLCAFIATRSKEWETVSGICIEEVGTRIGRPPNEGSIMRLQQSRVGGVVQIRVRVVV